MAAAVRAQAATKLRHVTVLLNAAVPAIRQAEPAADEWQTLLSILSALLQRMPGTHVRVIVFNLDQQRELLRKDDFTAADMNQVAHLADDAERWASRATPPPDTVIFPGLPETISENMPPGMPVRVRAPRFFYLKYAPVKQMASPFPEYSSGSGDNVSLQNQGRPGRYGEMDASNSREAPALPGDADRPDPIEQTVRDLNGKTLVVSSPAGFSKALATMDLR